jgi:hypothetical protein
MSLTGAPRLTEHKNLIQIEKLPLVGDMPDSRISSAFSDYEQQDLQFGLDWLSNLATTALEASETAVVFIARRAPDDFVALPLKLNTHTGYATSLSTFYSSNYSPIVRTAAPAILLQALFEHLVHREKIASITISPMDVDSPMFALLQDALKCSGWRGVHTFFCFGNWIHDLEGATYHSYLSARSSRLRNTVARRKRHFLDAGRGDLVLVTGGELLEDAIGHFVSIYNRSWKRPEPYPQFIPQLVRLAARRGWLRLGIAHYDGQPVASQIWLVWQGTAYIFKLAYHEDYKQLSAGTVLTACLLEHAIDRDGVSRIDYLSGDDAYKQDWMSKRRERHGIAAYNVRTLRGRGLLLGRAINTFIKSLKRRNKD